MRLFHWIFVTTFLSAFIIAKTSESDSTFFSIHSLIGLAMGFLILLRLVWGFLGPHHSKFSSFALRPSLLVGYFKNILANKKELWSGHNPASSWAAVTMIALGLGLSVTGYLMTSGPNKEPLEDTHEILANSLIVIAALHVIGVIVHTVRYRETIALSMIDGKKLNIPAADRIPSPQNAMGALLVGLMVAIGLILYRGYNTQTRELHLFGAQLNLGNSTKSE